MTIVAKVMLLVVLVNFICHSFVVRSWTLQRTSVWSIIRPKACTKTSHLHSTKLRWEQIPPYQEPNEDLDEDGSPKLSVLTGGHSAEKIDVDSLVQQWIDQCNADGRPNDVDKFTLQTAIPLVTKKNKFVELVNATLDLAQLRDKSITFISEEELKKLWVDGSFKAMGKPASSYSVQDALLLMDDGDSVDTWGAPEGEVVLDDKTELIVTQQELERVWASRSEISWGMPSRQFDQQAALLLLDADEDDEEVLDEVEILTRGVVEGVAGEVSSTAVGGGEGSEISAGSDSVYVGCSAMLSEGEEYISGHEAALLPPDNSVSERMAFWNKYPGRSNQYLRETLKRIHDDLEETPNHTPAWKKETNMLTPDIETQQFMGDIMFSNTYLTQRIPANWNDPEEGEMTEVYNSTATMAWPGQPETDFNTHVPMWEALQLPVGPEYARGKGLAQMLREQIEADANSNNSNSGGKSGDEGGDSAGHRADVQRQQQQQKGFIETMKAPTKKTTPRVVDWENFDFSGVGAAKDESPSHPPPTSASKPPQDELDKFFDSFGMSGSKASNSEGFLSVDGPGYNIDGDGDGETDSEVEEKQSLSSGFGLSRSVGGGGGGMAESVNYDDLSSEENASRRRALFQRTAVNGISSPDQVEPRFTTPANYLDQEEFKDHVGVEVWSNYRNQGFEEVDDVVWDDDVYTAQALRHLIAVTDEYLDDHSAAVEAHDEQKHWGRAMRNAFLGEDNQLEPIPEYLTPDKNRGIVYSDEIIEMKGKISLLPLQEEPEVEYKDDVFTHNKEFEVANKIGTIRVQYDWQPRTDLEHVIEEHKLPALQPVIDYINHAGKLVSTKDDIIIFQYKGVMRHLLGIRESMFAMAKKCYPSVQDLRLETTRTSDSFDC